MGRVDQNEEMSTSTHINYQIESVTSGSVVKDIQGFRGRG